MKPRINVVIPAYNHGRYLPSSIKSVREQQWPDLKIIVVDDGSTDETPRVLAELGGDDLSYIRQQNMGAAAARNRGIRESNAEWVAFLDADDYWLPGKLERQMRALDENRADFSYTGWLMIDGETAEARPAEPQPSMVSALIWRNFVNTSTIVARRSCLIEVGCFEEHLTTLSEDWDLWLRLATNYREVCIPEPLTGTRVAAFNQKYEVRNLEKATWLVLSRFFDSLEGREELSGLARQKRRITSFHFSVLAKSYLYQRDVANFLRCSTRCILTHPMGLLYIPPTRTRSRAVTEPQAHVP